MFWKIPHASGHLSLLTLEPMVCNRRSHHNEKQSHHKDPVQPKINFRKEQPPPGTESAALKKKKKLCLPLGWQIRL